MSKGFTDEPGLAVDELDLRLLQVVLVDAVQLPYVGIALLLVPPGKIEPGF